MSASSRDPMQRTSDINVVETRRLPSPPGSWSEIPKSEAQAEFVTRSRQDIHRLIFTDDRRLLLIVGPVLDPRRGRGARLRPAPGRARPRGRRPGDGRHAGLFREAADDGGLEGPDHGPAPRRVARHRRRAPARARGSCATSSTSGCRRRPSSSTRSPRSTSPTSSAGRRSGRGRPSRRPTARWPRASRCRSVSRTGPTGRSRPRSTPSGRVPAPDIPRHQPRRGRFRRGDAGNPDCHIVLRGGVGRPELLAPRTSRRPRSSSRRRG